MDVQLHRWELGFSQSRFNHVCRTCGASCYIPSHLSAFLTCYCPLWVSPLGKLGVLEGHCPQPSAPMEQSNSRRNGALPHCTALCSGEVSILGCQFASWWDRCETCRHGDADAAFLAAACVSSDVVWSVRSWSRLVGFLLAFLEMLPDGREHFPIQGAIMVAGKLP